MSLSLFFNEFYFSDKPPAGIAMPDHVSDIYAALKKNQAIHKRDCTGGFVFGGVFTSLYKGEAPRDIDLCVCSPELADYGNRLEELKAMDAHSYSERDEINETIDHLIGHMFPMTNNMMWDYESLQVKQGSAIGTSVQILYHVMTADGTKLVDMTFTERAVSPPEIFARAPICSAAYMLEDGNYCAHKDFEADIKSWRYRAFGALSAEAAEKAQNKGMTITPPMNVGQP